jgi:hypothetical protein
MLPYCSRSRLRTNFPRQNISLDVSQIFDFVRNPVTGVTEELDDPNGIGTTTFNGLNDRGQIVGFFLNGANNTIGLLATPAW